MARETGWSEQFLMRAPLARLLKYYHACLWANGAWTRKPVKKDAFEKVEVLLSSFTPPLEEETDD